MSNLPGYNPVAGPCTIRVKKTKPWKVISPLRHTTASILYALAFGWLVLPGIFSFADADFQKILHPASENVTIMELMGEMKPSNELYETDDVDLQDENDYPAGVFLYIKFVKRGQNYSKKIHRTTQN